jgi:hypothetical protein
MNGDEFLIIVIFLMVIFIAIGILFLNNKCSWLISGYNTMSEEEKEKYDEKALYKFMAYFMFVISACLGLIGIGGYYNIRWLLILATVLMVIVALGGVIYCNTGKRFSK